MEQTTQTQLVEIQQVVLRMSKYFVAFCEEHNLTSIKLTLILKEIYLVIWGLVKN